MSDAAVVVRESRAHAWGATASRWGPLVLPAVAGVVLRIIAVLGFPQPLWTPDSTGYLRCAEELMPLRDRPCGYSFFLWLLSPFRSVLFVVVVQHALGVAVAVLTYVLLVRRLDVRPVIAGVVVAPALLDADLIGLEHFLLSDALFCYLVMAAAVVVLWREPVTWGRAVPAGLLVGAASEVRTLGVPLVLVFGGYLLVRRHGLRAPVAFVLAAALPMAAYTGWVRSEGASATGPAGTFLWSRTAVFADCGTIRPRGDLARLCPRPDTRRWRSSAYVWAPNSPIRSVSGDQFSPRATRLGMRFAGRAIRAQPADYAALVLKQTAMAFEPTFSLPRFAGYRGEWYKFAFPSLHRPANAYAGGRSDHPYDAGVPPAPRRPSYAHPLIDYQRVATLPGPVLAIAFLTGLIGIVRRRHDLGGAAVLPWTLAAVLLVVPVMTADYDFRYVLPVIPLAFLAAGLAFRRRADAGQSSG